LKYCYLNGKIISLKKANLDLYDVGILRGYGIFDVMRTYNRKPFLIAEHLERLKNSAKILNLKIPISHQKIEDVIKKLLKNNLPAGKEAIIRTILTGGKTSDGINYNYHLPTFYILTEIFEDLPEEFYQNGIKLITHNYLRDFPEAKTLNYITAIKLQKALKKKGAFEILYTHNNFALECTTSNLFILKNKKLITPKSKVLGGITRNFVIKFAKNRFDVMEKNIRLKDLDSANEAFITATNKDIVPVVRIDNKIIGNGKVGDGTKIIMKMFNDYVKKC